MRKQKIAKIIFAKVLDMPLPRYLNYIERMMGGSAKPLELINPHPQKVSYAKIMIEDGTLCFVVSDKRLKNIYSTEDCSEDRIICSLNWINTRNKFSLHILESLLHYQREYWFSGKESDLKPLTLSRFLTLYPLQYLDKTRLSRLIPNLLVITPQNQIVNLKSLFISKKKHHAYRIKEIVSNNEDALKDKEVQSLLAQKGVHLSLRTICNCRKLLNIPNYKERDAYYYEKDITFSDYIRLSKKYFNKIPREAGVYELSISSKIGYPNHGSNVVYIGSSKNLRKRIANYTGNKLRNKSLKNFINNYDVFLRFYLTRDYTLIEKNFLKTLRINMASYRGLIV